MLGCNLYHQFFGRLRFKQLENFFHIKFLIRSKKNLNLHNALGHSKVAPGNRKYIYKMLPSSVSVGRSRKKALKLIGTLDMEAEKKFPRVY